MGIFTSKAESVAPYTRIRPEDVVSVLADMGFRPQLENAPNGEPLIRFQLEGVKSIVLFYGLENGTAKSFQFHCGFNVKAPLEKVNAFNSQWRWGKAYLDKDGDIHLVLDAEVEGGVLRAEIQEFVRDWATSVGNFVHDLVRAA